MNEYVEQFIELVKENPDISVMPVVDSEIVCDDGCAWWIAKFGRSWLGEYAIYEDRVYDDRDEFVEQYYEDNCDELCKMFNYNPRINKRTLSLGKCTEYEVLQNIEAEGLLDEYLEGVTNTYFTEAILINICVPDYK